MTTHDPRGGGRPRLIFALGDTAPAHASQREFNLVPGVTVIGSGPDADLRLEGLAARHAEIRATSATNTFTSIWAATCRAGSMGRPSAASRCAPATGSRRGTG